MVFNIIVTYYNYIKLIGEHWSGPDYKVPIKIDASYFNCNRCRWINMGIQSPELPKCEHQVRTAIRSTIMSFVQNKCIFDNILVGGYKLINFLRLAPSVTETTTTETTTILLLLLLAPIIFTSTSSTDPLPFRITVKRC